MPPTVKGLLKTTMFAAKSDRCSSERINKQLNAKGETPDGE